MSLMVLLFQGLKLSIIEISRAKMLDFETYEPNRNLRQNLETKRVFTLKKNTIIIF